MMSMQAESADSSTDFTLVNTSHDHKTFIFTEQVLPDCDMLFGTRTDSQPFGNSDRHFRTFTNEYGNAGWYMH